MRFKLLTVALLMTAALSMAADATSEPGTVLTSFYSDRMNGHITASKQVFSNDALTAASHEYSLGTKLKLTNPKNNRSVVVRVNDRGHNVKGRGLSVTKRAARELGFVKAGTAQLRVEKIS